MKCMVINLPFLIGLIGRGTNLKTNFRTLCTFVLFIAWSVSPVSASIKLEKVTEVSPKEDYLPVNLLRLDPKFSHHVILVEKSSHKIYLYSNENSVPKFIKEYTMASGKARGDKFWQGDLKTPEGVYNLYEFKSEDSLIKMYGNEGKIYGIGAFVLDYPNTIDRRNGKTGGGIWFHGTNDESRVAKGLDSRGCVVAVNSDVKEISKYIELNSTSMVIVENKHLVRKETWLKLRREVEELVENWVQAWQNEDINQYLSFYSKDQFKDSFRGNYKTFSVYKQGVFSRPGKPNIDVRDLSILGFKDYIKVQFLQDYSSNTIQDIGKKTLFIKKDRDYNLKIVAEIWNKLRGKRELAFVPKQTFFLD